jgi:cytochrome c553
MKSKPMKTLMNNPSSPICSRPATIACAGRGAPQDPMPTLASTPPRRQFLIGAALLLAACDYKIPEEPTASGDEIFELCSQCHGEHGEGRHEFNAPSIAGLPQWYVEAQLKKFRSGMRGTHPADLTGMQMRPMSMSLHNEADIKTVAAYVASLPRPAPAAMLEGGDANRGKALYATCGACHGVDGAGMEQVKAPPLKHASDWYLLAQLQKYKEGQRGLTGDVEGATMRPQVALLTDEQAMKDVVQYIGTLK